MSSGLPYLQKLRKSDLNEFADLTKLPEYAKMKKAELEVALDDHLRANSTTYSSAPSLTDYYKRLTSSSRSPVKKIAEKVSEMVSGDDDAPAPVKKVRRKTATLPPTDTSEGETTASALIKTPAKELARRSSILASQLPIPPSPAAVTDAIDVQTRRIRSSISHAYQRTQIHEYADATRDLLSSPLTINVLAIVVEAYGLRSAMLPNKLLTEVGPVPYFRTSKTAVFVPDLFQTLSGSFWAPFLLWLFTSLIAPATISYFINLPLKAHPSHNYATRRATVQADAQLQFDPFIFNVAKGLISYLVYAQHKHFAFGGLISHHSAATINASIPGGFATMLTSSGIGAAVALYEAALKK